MKNTKGNQIKLGIFVSISIALFIAGIYFIGQRQKLFSSSFKVSAIFKDISGLQVGNNVRFSGINVGIVEFIEQISDSTVRVDMMIVEDTRKFIKKNAKAIIGSDGLMGSKIIVIVPGTPGQKEIAHNDFLESAQPVSMDDIMVKLKETGDNAASLTGDLAIIMKNVREGRGMAGKLFMDTVFAETIDAAMVNIKQGAGGFKQNMDAASHNVLLRGYLKKKTNDHEKQVKQVKEDKQDKQDSLDKQEKQDKKDAENNK